MTDAAAHAGSHVAGPRLHDESEVCIQVHGGQCYRRYWQAKNIWMSDSSELRLNVFWQTGDAAGALYLANSMHLQKRAKLSATPSFFDDGGSHSDLNEWVDVSGIRLGVMPSVEEAGRVLQSSLAQGYSMSQTIPGQRLHAVMEHG